MVSQMKNYQAYVEIKTVTWMKDSHGLFDYESKNVVFNKNKVDCTSKVYKEGNEITIKNSKETGSLVLNDKSAPESAALFSVVAEDPKNENFTLKVDETTNYEYTKSDSLFLIVRSLKNEDGTQKGYNLDIGDIIRLGRIEYRVIEYQDHNQKISSLFSDDQGKKISPFNLIKKTVGLEKTETKKQCRICLMDESEVEEVLVNPCNCRGTSEYVHINCMQDWLSSKMKKKIYPGVACTYWKKLCCEVCKVSLPDLVNMEDKEVQMIPIQRPETPYILLERVFYDKTKEGTDNDKMLVLLDLTDQTNSIKLGRGHECDLRENDISVSRFHAYIKYVDGNFVIFDNNSKFGTLVFLRKSYNIEKKKIALQIGRTVMTFSTKQISINNIPVFKHPNLMEKFNMSSPKNIINGKLKLAVSIKSKNFHPQQQAENKQEQQQNPSLNFLDD